MIIKEGATVYVCEHCGKKLFRKHAMVNHEFNCSHNPKNYAACSACVFLEEKQETVYYTRGHDGSEVSAESRSFFCSKYQKGLYPFKAVRKGLIEKYPETFHGQEQMPRTCEGWDYQKDNYVP